MFGDLKFTMRQLRKAPGFALTAIITLALGIGANAVVFSVLNALILRPVNVPDGQSLYTVQRFQYPSHSYPDYLDLRDQNRTFESLVTFEISGSVGVNISGDSSTAWPYMASGNYFDALHIRPYLGRFFHASDEKGMNSAPYLVLSYAWWHSTFHDDAGVVGRTVEINKHPFTILGVAPPDFRGTELFFSPAFWIPMVEKPLVEGSDGMKYRGNHSSFIIGHLKPGITTAQAVEDLNAIGARLAKAYPQDDEGIKFSLARPGLVGDMLGGPARAFMAGLMLLAGLILLAACANLGNLFTARASDRGKEVALRLALGSRRSRILRQLLSEAIIVSVCGGILGLAGGVAILRVLSEWHPIPDVPINIPVNPDIRTYVLALLLALICGFLFGLVPVRQILRSDPWQAIRTGMTDSGGMRRFTLRDVLLAAQIAICAVLVMSSFVAVRGLERSLHSSYGFVPQSAVLVESDLHMAGYAEEGVPQMQQRLQEASAAIPGVVAAGYIDQIPLGLGGSDSEVFADTITDFRPGNAAADAMCYRISPGYLNAAGTKLLAGRNLTMHDDKNAPKVALVSRHFAEKVFGSVNKAVGAHFKYWGGLRAEVVGVIEDGKYRTLTEEQKPAMFFSFLQHPTSGTWLVVRSQRDPHEIAEALRTRLHDLDPALPLKVRTWNEEMDGALFAARVATVALGVLGLLGAVLAVTGLFGMASYVVSKRLRELGIRVALGAGKRQILSTSLGRALRLLTVGSVTGLVLGVLSTRVLSQIVYQATPKDPLVMGGIIATMLVLGLVATWIPARRALAVDPLVLLREE